MIVHIEDPQDPRLDAYVRLTDMQLRNRLEPERGIFIAESPKVIGRAMDAGLQSLSFLTTKKLLAAHPGLQALSESAAGDTPLFVLPDSALEELTGFQLAHGALAAFRRPPTPSVEEVLRGAKRVAVLEDITNFTNVGAIFRSAAALGVDALLVTPGCYNPLYRRAIRVSMGTVFQVPWTRIGADEIDNAKGAHGNVEHKGGWTRTGMPMLREAGFKVAALALSSDAVMLDDPRLAVEPRLALVLGTEGAGLAPATIQQADYVVRIPMAHGVDSLNVAAASAVAFWELRTR